MRRETHVGIRSLGVPRAGNVYRKCIARRVVVFHNEPRSHRLGKQSRRRRVVLEQRQMRRDVCRAPTPWPLRPGQIERADPERTGDSAHEHRAIARKPGQPARVERLLRARLEASRQHQSGLKKPESRLDSVIPASSA
jgi:hypothetical protein